MKSEANPPGPAAPILRSPYAPLSPSGPLPPQLGAATVKAAYTELGVSLSHVLSLVTVKGNPATDTAAQRLRRALDQPSNRKNLTQAEGGHKSLHEILFQYLKRSSHGQGVYLRLIKPCIRDRNGLAFLDHELFARHLEAEVKEVGVRKEPITPRSPEDALVGFVLAFCLLQPDEAEQVLRSVIRLGPAYAQFFGITQVELPLVESVPGALPRGPGPFPAAESPVPSPLALAASLFDPVPEKFQGRLPRVVELQQLRDAGEAAKRVRQRVGAAESLDRPAFDDAVAREQDAQEKLQRWERLLPYDSRKLLEEARCLLEPYVGNLQVISPEPAPADVLARWLDATEQQVGELRNLRQELEEKQALLHQLAPQHALPPAALEPCTRLDDASVLLRQRLHSLEQELLTLANWRAELQQLREELADCIRSAESSSLRKLAPERVLVLVQGCRLEAELEPLSPLVLRLLAEAGAWTTDEPPPDQLRVVRELLDASARSGDAERHTALTSYLSTGVVQSILRSSNDQVSRHLVLAAFRESIARQQPTFFHHVWQSSGWHHRRVCVGERLFRLYEGLQRLLATLGGIHPVLLGIASPRHESMVDGDFETRRRQVAEDVARRLEETTGVTGHFFRLRSIACRTFFRPLAPAVRQRRLQQVQPALLSLEHRFREERLVQEVLEKFGDTRELRSSHHDSVTRYINERLDELREWVDAESLLLRVIDQAEENPAWGEVTPLIQQLCQQAEETPPAEPGSVEWLERGMGELLSQLRDGNRPDHSLAFFGELPAVDTLFQAHEAGSRVEGAEPKRGAAREPWPSWLDRTPHSERLWVRGLRGEVTWLDVLQDGVARLLLGRRRTPAQVLQSFLDARELDAALEAAQFPGFHGTAEMTPLVQQLRELADQSQQLRHQLEELETRHTVLLQARITPQERELLDRLLQALIEGHDALERLDLETGRARTATIREQLEAVERRLQAEANALLKRREGMEGWLEAAKVAFPKDAPIPELERRKQETLEAARPRRLHLLRLRELDHSGVPERLRAAVRTYLLEADHPARWPSVAAVGNADFYMELLVQISSDWWATLRALSPAEQAHQRLSRIAELLAERLPQEMEAAVGGTAGAPTMMSLLMEPGSNVEALYHDLLRQHGLLKDPVPGRSPPVERRKSWSGRASERALQRLEAVLKAPASIASDGRVVENALSAFERGEVAEARELSLQAWGWARSNQRFESQAVMAAIHTWTSHLADPRGGHPALDALGLLLRHVGSFRKGGGLEARLLANWLELSGLAAMGDDKGALAIQLSEALIQVARTPAGDSLREQLGTLLRVADPAPLAELLWTSISGAARGRDGRTALLELLYDLEESDALGQLFEREGENERYLNAFITLVSRAAVDPSPKLLTAIRQNLRTLERLKNAPFKDFARRLYNRLRLPEARVQLELVSDVLEPHERQDDYRLLIRITPDESDPPLTLRLHLLESDFRLAEGQEPVRVITEKEAMLDARECELPIRPRDRASARIIVLQAEGETASGNPLSVTNRFEVQFTQEDRFARIPVDELLDIYPGYDAKPVSGQAFVGRHEELEQLSRALARGNPGAAILYGARRLGKTSLLDELRKRHCVTERREASQTLFIVIAVDSFQIGEPGVPFLERFFQHIRTSIFTGIKNQGLRTMLDKQGVSMERLVKCGKLGGEFDSAPFIAKLREFLRRLRELAGSRYSRTVLVMDEFDKLLEAYRKNMRNEVEELINQLRLAATEEQELGLLLAGSDLMRGILDHYRSAMYGSATVIQLEGFHDLEKARQIIAPTALQGRREFGDAVCREVIKITGGHPLYMRLVGCAASHLSNHRRVSIGTIHEAVDKLLRGQVLKGTFPDPLNLVKQPLSALKLMESETEERLCRLLLLQLARPISLERPWARWAVISQDEKLEALRPAATWSRLRDRLYEEARLLTRNEKQLWSFSYPILAAALRVGWEHEFETLYMQLRSTSEAGN